MILKLVKGSGQDYHHQFVLHQHHQLIHPSAGMELLSERMYHCLMGWLFIWTSETYFAEKFFFGKMQLWEKVQFAQNMHFFEKKSVFDSAYLFFASLLCFCLVD